MEKEKNWEERRIPLSETNQDAYMRLRLNKEADGGADGPLPAIVYFPGGGYRKIHEPSVEPVAEFFRGKGFHVFVVNYSINEKAAYPAPLLEASKAVWLVRKNAKEWNVDPDRISLMGMSAGSHLCTALSTMWQYEECRSADPDMPYGGNRPNAIVTGYTPTIFSDFFDQPAEVLANFKGQGPDNLIGAEGTRWADIHALTTHDLVTKDTCPAFLWKSTTDFPGDTFAYADALKREGIPYEVHVFYDEGVNCVGMGKEGASLNTMMWPEMASNWLKKVLKVRV